jgi:hypothetical protein
MSQLRFRIPALVDTTPEEWFHFWAAKYPSDEEYDFLIARHKLFSTEDFVQLAKWKDGVRTEKQWKPNIASVAYLIWMQVAEELPKCPNEAHIRAFLNDWSGRMYTDVFATKQVKKRFGLSRATTLLHFLSGGAFPIADSRVRIAFARLAGSSVPDDTVDWYLEELCPLFEKMSALCKAGNPRALDKALFCFGGSNLSAWD